MALKVKGDRFIFQLASGGEKNILIKKNKSVPFSPISPMHRIAAKRGLRMSKPNPNE